MNNNGDCDEFATCENTPGSYNCKCNNGFAGNGRVCTGTHRHIKCLIEIVYATLHFCCLDIDECLNNNDCVEDAHCTNNPGSYSCICNEGYAGDGTRFCTGARTDN